MVWCSTPIIAVKTCIIQSRVALQHDIVYCSIVHKNDVHCSVLWCFVVFCTSKCIIHIFTCTSKYRYTIQSNRVYDSVHYVHIIVYSIQSNRVYDSVHYVHIIVYSIQSNRVYDSVRYVHIIVLYEYRCRTRRGYPQ